MKATKQSPCAWYNGADMEPSVEQISEPSKEVRRVISSHEQRREAPPSRVSPGGVEYLRTVATEAAATSSEEELQKLVVAIEEILSGAALKDDRLSRVFADLSEEKKIVFRSEGEHLAQKITSYARKPHLSPVDQEKIHRLITQWLISGGTGTAFAGQHAVICLAALTMLLEGSYTDRIPAIA